MLVIQEATPEDSRDVFAWRNDAVSRAMFRTTQPVSWEEHVNWYNQVLGDPLRELLILRDEKGRLGVVRFDFDKHGQAEISINLRPERRGRGLGEPALRLACAFGAEKLGLRSIRAEVRLTNKASQRIFQRVGFVRCGRRADFILYELMSPHSAASFQGGTREHAPPKNHA